MEILLTCAIITTTHQEQMPHMMNMIIKEKVTSVREVIFQISMIGEYNSPLIAMILCIVQTMRHTMIKQCKEQEFHKFQADHFTIKE